jgi:UDP-N-acetylmuramyl pentapeptide phosphotransferase/UDP-N-acetylglucosamine-1-phosphate transferase
MLDVLLSITLSFLITFFTLPVVLIIANQKNLFDIPNERKIHTSQIASLGGFAIFTGFILTSLISVRFANALDFQYFLAAALVIFFIGLKDDILGLTPFAKFLGQFLAASLLYKGGIQLNNMEGFLNFHALPERVGMALTYITIILIINAFNLIDGIDGLAATLALMIALLLGFYFVKIDFLPYGHLAFSLAGTLIAFLIFNFPPAKIFMGDSGSLLIGLIISMLTMKFINVAPHNNIMPISSSPAIGFSLLIIPILDTVRLFTSRIFSRRSPFLPDKNHIHHLLMQKGFNCKNIIFLLVLANFAFLVFAFIGNSLGSTWLIIIQSTVFFGCIGILVWGNRSIISHAKQNKVATIKSISLHENVSFKRDSINVK